MVFIDDYFSVVTDRNRVLKSLQDQLGLLTPEDRMAVVAYNGKNVDMLSSWSQSYEDLEDVFRRAQSRPALGLQRRAERRIFELRDEDVTGLNLSAVESEIGGVVNATVTLEEQQQIDLIAGQVERAVIAASSALRSFANPPGRKVMLLLSGGWPYNPTEWVINDPDRVPYAAGYQNYGRLYSPLTETANRLSYTLYPVDVPGFGSSDISAEDSSIDQANLRTRRLFNREQEEELALTSLARATGGRAALDSNSLEAFSGAVEDTRSYYWLGFTPTWQGDDSEHDIKIRPRRKGLKVRSRAGFSDLSRETEVTMMVESSLLFGDPPSAAPLRVEVGKGKKSGFGKVILPLRIAIPVGALTFLPQGDKWVADTELRVAVLDDTGNTSDIPVIPLGIRTDDEPTAEDFTVYETSMKVRKRQHDMVVSLYDRLSGKILSSKVTFDPDAVSGEEVGSLPRAPRRSQGSAPFRRLVSFPGIRAVSRIPFVFGVPRRFQGSAPFPGLRPGLSYFRPFGPPESDRPFGPPDRRLRFGGLGVLAFRLHLFGGEAVEGGGFDAQLAEVEVDLAGGGGIRAPPWRGATSRPAAGRLRGWCTAG